MLNTFCSNRGYLVRHRRDGINFNGGVEKKWEGMILKSFDLGLAMRDKEF